MTDSNKKNILKKVTKVNPITAAISSTASAIPVVKEFFDPKSGIKPKTLGGWGRKFESKVDRHIKKNYPKVHKKLKKIQYKASDIEKKLNKKIQIKISKWKNPEAWKSHGGRVGHKSGNLVRGFPKLAKKGWK